MKRNKGMSLIKGNELSSNLLNDLKFLSKPNKVKRTGDSFELSVKSVV